VHVTFFIKALSATSSNVFKLTQMVWFKPYQKLCYSDFLKMQGSEKI